MAKSAHSHKHYHIGIIILIVFFALVSFKLLISKGKWYSYVVDSQKSVMHYKSVNSVEDAGVIAATIVSVPEGAPLFKQPVALQNYVETLSETTGRDIVVVDAKKKILADTIAANVGATYMEDKGDEVAKTIADGAPRDFVEKSTDYPDGITQTVIYFKDRGSVVGAIILSTSKIFQ